jgi:geranylgeranyl pyrophosphate synthase
MNDKIEKFLEANLQHHLSLTLRNSSIRPVYEYALLPAGKLFRPKLVAASYQATLGEQTMKRELQNPLSNLSLLCSVVEIHHAYTLVHDDLPCMDDDDMRRGRPSTHIQFGQWQALLAGDGLHALSYQLLSKVHSSSLPLLLRLMGHTLGVSGLIEGQALDCSGEMKKDFLTLRTTHLLKTARLIQFSLLAGHIIASAPTYRSCVELARLGETLGVAFQLIDDLSELSEDLSLHEQDINPWINFKEESFHEIQKILNQALGLLEKRPSLQAVFARYISKMLGIITLNQQRIEEQLKAHKDLERTIGLLQLLCASEKRK